MILDELCDREVPFATDLLKEHMLYPLSSTLKIEWYKLMKQRRMEKEFCVPVLQTPQPHSNTGELVDLIYALMKRNMDPPVLHNVRSQYSRRSCKQLH